MGEGVDEEVEWLWETMSWVIGKGQALTDSSWVVHSIVHYVAWLVHNEGWRLFFELVMFVILLRFLFSSTYRPKENPVKLTKKEVDSLVEEWEPDPLVPPASQRILRDVNSIPVIHSRVGLRVSLPSSHSALNFASYNFLGLVGEESIEKAANTALRNYGVGSCGPPGFYGTIDVHMELEQKIAKFLGTEEAILYSYAFSTIASTIPAFSKKGDLIICDDAVGFPIQRGVIASRSHVRYFKHNDMEDLEKILIEIKEQDKKKKKRLNRRFIISEGLFQNTGDICPLPKLVELKNKYKFRLIIDESFSIGVLGKTGRGVCEEKGVKPSQVDILTGALSHSLAAGGGYCAANTPVVDHQRLSGAGYCYSASMPAMLATAAVHSLKIVEEQPQRISRLRENILSFRSCIAENPVISVKGDPLSPIIFIHLKNRLSSRDKEEDFLQAVVDEALSKGVLFTRSKYAAEEEINLPPPSIRVSISQGHSKDDVLSSASLLNQILMDLAPKFDISP